MEKITQTTSANAQSGAAVAGELTTESESLNEIVRILSGVVEGNSSALRAA
jgi:hypothetical protein